MLVSVITACGDKQTATLSGAPVPSHRDGSHGRLSALSITRDIGLCSYVRADPINHVDPDGTHSNCITVPGSRAPHCGPSVHVVSVQKSSATQTGGTGEGGRSNRGVEGAGDEELWNSLGSLAGMANGADANPFAGIADAGLADTTILITGSRTSLAQLEIDTRTPLQRIDDNLGITETVRGGVQYLRNCVAGLPKVNPETAAVGGSRGAIRGAVQGGARGAAFGSMMGPEGTGGGAAGGAVAGTVGGAATGIAQSVVVQACEAGNPDDG
jgi:hypothetical protein